MNRYGHRVVASLTLISLWVVPLWGGGKQAEAAPRAKPEQVVLVLDPLAVPANGRVRLTFFNACPNDAVVTAAVTDAVTGIVEHEDNEIVAGRTGLASDFLAWQRGIVFGVIRVNYPEGCSPDGGLVYAPASMQITDEDGTSEWLTDRSPGEPQVSGAALKKALRLAIIFDPMSVSAGQSLRLSFVNACATDAVVQGVVRNAVTGAVEEAADERIVAAGTGLASDFLIWQNQLVFGVIRVTYSEGGGCVSRTQGLFALPASAQITDEAGTSTWLMDTHGRIAITDEDGTSTW